MLFCGALWRGLGEQARFRRSSSFEDVNRAKTGVNAILPQCPKTLPPDLTEPLRILAAAWAESELRPRPAPDVVKHWDELVQAWAADPALPLFIRKSSDNRGSLLRHVTGRQIAPVDNSPAVWAFACALRGEKPMLDEVAAAIQSNRVPVAMVLKAVERAQASLTCTLRAEHNLNTAGWKLAHIEPVGLRMTRAVEDIELARVQSHHRLLMSPSNMFLVPREWAGLGELPEVQEVFRLPQTNGTD